MVGYDSDELIERAGGRYRFVVLIQRRMRELQRGAQPLVERKPTLFETAIEELRAGKIWLVEGAEADQAQLEHAAELPGSAPAPAEAAASPRPE